MLLTAAALAAIAAPALAQVEVTELAAPDAFSTPGRDTGLKPDLWQGTPIDTARAVLPQLSTKPISPAAAALALRVLATGAKGPEGAAGDEALSAARARALLTLGDFTAAMRVLDRAPGQERNPELARVAAEAALLADQAGRACAIADGLATGRGDIYWLRLRAFCLVEAGEAAPAQLTFDLAQSQGRDAVFGRLMAARMSGSPPGAASLRNGLDLALSRALALDLMAAKPSPAVAAALNRQDPVLPAYDTSAIDADIGGLATAILAGMPPEGGLSALIAAATDAEPKSRARLQSAALLVAALMNDLAPPDRARLATFVVSEGKSQSGRNLAMELAAESRRTGEVALLALWTAVEAGEAGPALPDRVRIVRTLSRAGLMTEARLFALEGLAALK
jgi:hypothetical protein